MEKKSRVTLPKDIITSPCHPATRSVADVAVRRAEDIINGKFVECNEIFSSNARLSATNAEAKKLISLQRKMSRADVHLGVGKLSKVNTK